MKKLALFLLTIAILALKINLHAQGTAFTYQGQLADSSRPANGSYDLRFIVYDNDPGGNQRGPILTNSATTVVNGLFTVTLDFGAIFTGSNYWLDVAVRTNGNGVFFELVPRQPFTPTPYAILANSASNLMGSLPLTQLSAGTAGISITGSAASVTGSFAGDVTGTQSATAVTTVGGVTAANVASGANAANAATTNNTANTIVERDGSGNFSAGNLSLQTRLTFAGNPAIFSGNTPIVISFGDSFFAGSLAGNLNESGRQNTGLGVEALLNNVNGHDNVAVGHAALEANTLGGGNVAVGSAALASNLRGSGNTGVGLDALFANITGGGNTSVGNDALEFNTNGSENVALGATALNQNLTGSSNTAIGFQALAAVASGSGNIGLGPNVLPNLETGSGNIAIGVNAGSAISTGNDNIDIGNAGFGNESGVIRIGTLGTHTKAVFNGIFGTTVGGGAAVQVNASGLLGTVTSSRRFKQNIQSMATASDVLLSLKPVTFQYKPELDPDGTPQFGLIAEDVEKVDPALVLHDDKHQIYTVRYEAVNAMLLNEFLKQHDKVQEQTDKIQHQEKEIEDLKQSVARLEKLMLAERK